MTDLLSDQGDRAMRVYYDQRATEYDEWYLRRGRFVGRGDDAGWHADVDALRARVAGFAEGRLLEIAAGTGWWTQHLAARARVTTLDFAPRMLEVARARLRAQGRHADAVRADAYRLPFADASFERCFFGFWLSHVPHARLAEFLGEVRRVVRPGGLVLVLDSAPSAPGQQPGEEQLVERVLNDGSCHAVLKILHTPDTLGAALAPLGAPLELFATQRYFSGALVRR